MLRCGEAREEGLRGELATGDEVEADISPAIDAGRSGTILQLTSSVGVC